MRAPSGGDGSGANQFGPVGNASALGLSLASAGPVGMDSTGGLRGAGASASGVPCSAAPAPRISCSYSEPSELVQPGSFRGASSRSVTANYSSRPQPTRMSAALKYQPRHTRLPAARLATRCGWPPEA